MTESSENTSAEAAATEAPQPETITATTAAAEALAQSMRDWLPEHCKTLPGVSRAITVVADADSHNYRIAATWPADFPGTPEMLAMADIGFTGRSEAKRIKTESGVVDRIVMPVSNQGRFLGALVVEADGLNSQKRKNLYATINGNPPKRTSPEEAAGHRLAIVLDLLAACLNTERAHSAALNLVMELAMRTGCDRVSYGRINRRGQLRIAAISDSTDIAERCTLVRTIETAMGEAIDQGNTIVFPRSDNSMIVDNGHLELSQMQGDSHVLTVPLIDRNRLVGAITLERRGTTPLGAGIIELCETLAAVAGPLLELKHRDNQPLLQRLADSVRRRGRTTA
ncbi:MAG: GAF domain-containing protein [Gammaproteobacteria bacterium]|nr:GAF domain-containing protein [Gammaproteobacteria bacterium]